VKDTLKIMKGHPVTIRLLDPPLHEFVPHDSEKLHQLSKELGISMSLLNKEGACIARKQSNAWPPRRKAGNQLS